MGLRLLDVEIRRFEVERCLLGPQALDDAEPLGAVAIAIVVRPLRALEISISGANQPITRLRAKRPLEMWSMVVACFAATMGCTVGTCEVAAIMMFLVA